jgi:hypothetical protein
MQNLYVMQPEQFKPPVFIMDLTLAATTKLQDAKSAAWFNRSLEKSHRIAQSEI